MLSHRCGYFHRSGHVLQRLRRASIGSSTAAALRGARDARERRLVPTAASLLCLHPLIPYHFSLVDLCVRQDLHRLFHGASVLVWDGTAVQGVNDCAALFQLLPSSKHTVETFDVQPITGHTAQHSADEGVREGR